MLGRVLGRVYEGDHAMTLLQSDLSDPLDALRAGGGIDVVRRSLEFMLQALIEAEASEQIGAAPNERTASRTNQRNGHRARLLSTKAGHVSKSRSRRCGAVRSSR
jgi:putative transposase